jgi:hypothetical protein
MSRARPGMALAVTIGVVSLIAILAVATLSLAGRLVQTSSLGLRDARLDAAAAFGLSSVTDEWRQRQCGRLAVGATVSFDVSPGGVPVAVAVTVTRIAPELFWVVAEASDAGISRRENLVLRTRLPDPTSLLNDSANVETLGTVEVDSVAAAADVQLASGAMEHVTNGVVHARGDLTLVGGTGTGMLIVEGRLIITGPLSYEGVIVARGGISVVVPGVTITGVIRSGGTPLVAGNMAVNLNGSVAQNVILQSLTPLPVAGRRWAEMP